MSKLYDYYLIVMELTEAVDFVRPSMSAILNL